MKIIRDLIVRNNTVPCSVKTFIGLPTKETIDDSYKKYHENNQKKKCNDCAYMRDLVNKTLNDAIQDTRYNYITNKIDLFKINDYMNINIKKCDNFKEYERELKERGITIKIQKVNTGTLDVYFHREERTIVVQTKW